MQRQKKMFGLPVLCKVKSPVPSFYSNKLSGTVVLLMTVGLFGCANSPDGRAVPWWSQGPGNVDDAGNINTPEPRESDVRDRSPGTVAIPSTAIEPSSARYGDLLFVSGQYAAEDAVEPADGAFTVAQETRSVMQKLQTILNTHRLTMSNVVSATVYLTSLDDLPAVKLAYDSYFRGPQPAMSIVEVSRLPGNSRVQISVVAGR